MKALLIAMFLVLVAIPGFAAPQTDSRGATGPQSASNQSAVMAASNSLRVLSPTLGEKIGSTAVTLRYQLTDSAASAAPSPTYRVQLDGRDPAETLDTEYSFTGLAPGDHTLIVELVDANHTPISGSRAVVHFKTFTPGATQRSQTTGALVPPAIIKAELPIPSTNPTDELPSAGGELPLLSMVGFGVLVGGIISAMRTRK
ncbi:MAG: hypothetical protein ACXVZV_11155 [Terriglobales bacterium]